MKNLDYSLLQLIITIINIKQLTLDSDIYIYYNG